MGKQQKEISHCIFVKREDGSQVAFELLKDEQKQQVQKRFFTMLSDSLMAGQGYLRKEDI